MPAARCPAACKELRSRLIWSVLAFVVAMVLCYFVWNPIFDFLTQPICQALEKRNQACGLILLKLQEGFFVAMRIAFFGGFVLAFPVVGYQLWRFIAPGLYRSEKAAFLPFLIASPVMFLIGGAFAYVIMLPFAFDFFQAGVQRGGQSVPEVEEGVLFLADVHEHGLEARFYVFDAALEDAAYDVVFAFALDGVFFQHAVFQKGYAAFEFLGIDDDGGAFHGITGSEAEGSFNFFKHFCKHGV